MTLPGASTICWRVRVGLARAARYSVLMPLDRLLTLSANLLPLAGVWWWGWNIFDVLILYWMQTVLLVLFTLLHITKVPESGLGMITVNGRARPATRRDYLMIFSLVGTVFCAAHLLFLWVFFSGQLNRIVHGPVTFWQHMVIASGAWVALLLNLVGGLARYLLLPPRADVVHWIFRRIGLAERDEPPENIDGMLAALFVRIFLMQAAIIFGAMLLQSYGTIAPLMILIVLKTLIDFSGGLGAMHARTITALRK
jgi:hypothetical protein